VTDFKPDTFGDRGIRRESLYIAFDFTGPVDKETSRDMVMKAAEYLESRRDELDLRDIYSFYVADGGAISLFFRKGVVSDDFFHAVREDPQKRGQLYLGTERGVAYAITARRIDPLYVIDLTDPADPFLAGELFVTGFSDFLHPVTAELLLGLGTGANGGIKLELFDVSNIAQPLSRGSTTLGGRGSWSEAQYDRHAFSYQSDLNGVDRFTIPAQLYSADGSFNFVESGLYLFEIRDRDVPAVAALNAVGSIIPDVGGFEIPFVASRNRAFLHSDTVYYVRDETAWAAFWHTPSVVNGPF